MTHVGAFVFPEAGVNQDARRVESRDGLSVFKSAGSRLLCFILNTRRPSRMQSASFTRAKRITAYGSRHHEREP